MSSRSIWLIHPSRYNSAMVILQTKLAWSIFSLFCSKWTTRKFWCWYRPWAVTIFVMCCSLYKLITCRYIPFYDMGQCMRANFIRQNCGFVGVVSMAKLLVRWQPHLQWRLCFYRVAESSQFCKFGGDGVRTCSSWVISMSWVPNSTQMWYRFYTLLV